MRISNIQTTQHNKVDPYSGPRKLDTKKAKSQVEFKAK